jgi:PEP-CTERM motif
MPRIALCLVLVLCFVPLAGAATIDANNAGCNGGGGGSCNGPYLLGGEGGTTLTFDYSIPNATVKKMVSLEDVNVGFGVWDTNNGKDTSTKSFTIELLVGSNSWTLGSSGNVTLQGFKSSNRDPITETLLDSAELTAFLSALKGSKGKFSVEIIADTGSFNVGTQDRFATLDYTPEPASLGMAGMGLFALSWTLRKKLGKRG